MNQPSQPRSGRDTILTAQRSAEHTGQVGMLILQPGFLESGGVIMSVTSTYQVEGMTCDHCVRSVRQEVSAIPGVTEVDVDLGSGKVTVTSESDLDSDALGHAIDEAGYTLIQ